jgi:hypothetical protein
MSTMAMRPVVGPHEHSPLEQRALSPGRIALLVAAACTVAFFAIAAPLVGNPARRLFTLDNIFTGQDELAVPSERTPELSPSNQWVAVDTIDLETTPVIILPALEVTSP